MRHNERASASFHQEAIDSPVSGQMTLILGRRDAIGSGFGIFDPLIRRLPRGQMWESLFV
jgi:hypothetical protein